MLPGAPQFLLALLVASLPHLTPFNQLRIVPANHNRLNYFQNPRLRLSAKPQAFDVNANPSLRVRGRSQPHFFFLLANAFTTWLRGSVFNTSAFSNQPR